MHLPQFARFTAALALFAASALGAQRPAPVPVPQPVGAGTLVGIVVDTGGRRLDSVLVYAPIQNRNTRSESGGQFRLNGLPEGPEVQVGFKKIGYESQVLYLKLDKGGGAIRVAMVPLIQMLPKVVTEARQPGLRGVVSDSVLRPLRGARVEAVPSGAGSAITDVRGSFVIDAKPGSYIVTVSLKGHETRMLSVTIPPEGGRQVALSLRPIVDKGRFAREAWAISNMRDRLLMKYGPFSKLYSHEDLLKFPDYDLRQIAQRSTAVRVDEQCMASVDGDPMESTPVWAIDVKEIEMLEVYGSPVARPGTKAPRGITSLSSARGVGTQTRAPTLNQNLKCPQIVVWTRK